MNSNPATPWLVGGIVLATAAAAFLVNAMGNPLLALLLLVFGAFGCFAKASLARRGTSSSSDYRYSELV